MIMAKVISFLNELNKQILTPNKLQGYNGIHLIVDLY